MGGRLARARRRVGHRAGQRGRAGDHRGGPREPRVHRPGDERLRGLQGQGRVVHARVRRARDRRPGRPHPRARPRLRDGRQGDDLLDPRHHRAPQRGRQRHRADQPRGAHRARRPVRQWPEPAPRPEQRPGRRRHGRPARPAAGLPARRERRAPGAVRRGLGRPGPAEARLAPVGHVRRDGARRPHRGLRHRREPDPVRGRPAPDDQAHERPRVPRRPGHVPDEDRRDRRRRPPGRGRLGRERGHGHQLRAPGPAGPQGARAAGRGARRPVDRLRARPPDGPRLGRGVGRADLERAPHALAGPRRDELQAARGARRPPVAVLRREPPGRAVPPLPPLGGPGARATASRSSAWTTTRPSTSCRRLPDPAHDRPPARLVQHRRPDRRLHLAAAARRVARHLARGRGGLRPRARRAGPGHLAPRPDRGPDPDRRVAATRSHVHDPPLPGRRRDEPADDRRHRPEVRHGRVQGHGDPDREAGGAAPA